MAWPIYNDIDRSRLQNWKQWLGFFARPSASHDWVGAIDQAHQEGLMRIFPHTIATGSKGFAMGWQSPIGAEQWTDDGSYYAELHGGLAPTFWDTVSIGAHQAIEWEETWYPLAGLNDISTADDEVAFYAAQTGPDGHGRLDVGVYTTRPRQQARLAAYWRGGCSVILERTSDLMTPATPLTISHDVQVPAADLGVVFTAGDELLAQYNLTNDGQAPVAWLDMLPTYILGPDIPVDVHGTDPDCVHSFDVQMRDGWAGQWTTWLTATVGGTHWFPGQDGHTYYFRVRARDLPGNQSRYTDNLRGDTFTSVLLTSAPVLDTSEKVALPFDQLMPGSSYIGYSIDLWNSGTLTATVTLTDTLPPSSTPSLDTLSFNGVPAPELFQEGVIQWSGIITPDQQAVLNYHLSPIVNLSPGTIITNTVSLQYERGLITRTATVTVPYLTYLPLVTRNFIAPW
jgi:hypothetical protein